MSITAFVKPMLRPVFWVLRIVVFIALFGLAVKNSGPVELRFYFDQIWHAPVSVVMLGCFALGALIGLTAVAGRIVRRHKD